MLKLKQMNSNFDKYNHSSCFIPIRKKTEKDIIELEWVLKLWQIYILKKEFWTINPLHEINLTLNHIYMNDINNRLFKKLTRYKFTLILWIVSIQIVSK